MLGHELCKFSNVTCSAFSTVELPRETAARGRRRARTQAKAAKPDGPDGSIAPALSSGMRSKKQCKKKLNLSIYKLHSLSDYVRTIRMFGTTDSFSTQPVSTVLWIQSPPKDLPYLEGTALRHNWMPTVISQFATHFLGPKTTWDLRISVFKSHPAWMKMMCPHSVLGRPNFGAPSSLGRWSARTAEVWCFCLNIALPSTKIYLHCC